MLCGTALMFRIGNDVMWSCTLMFRIGNDVMWDCTLMFRIGNDGMWDSYSKINLKIDMIIFC